MRVQCPYCETSYTVERLGLTPPADQEKGVQGTVICVLCEQSFNFSIRAEVIEVRTEPQGWVDWALRRPAKTTDIRDWVVATAKRDA
jgi:hypothetical protein